MIALCRYILQGGQKCKQAALKDGPYCRHHQIVRKAVADAAPMGGDPYLMRRRLPFVFPEDRASVQINYFILLQAINDRRVDAKTAGIMMRVLKATDANLKKGPLDESSEQAGKSAGQQVSEDTARQVSNTDDDSANELLTQEADNLADEAPNKLDHQPASEDAGEPDEEAEAQNLEPLPPLELDEETVAALHEMDRLYRNDPDYADRVRDAIWMSQQPKPAPATGLQGMPGSDGNFRIDGE